MEELAYLIEAKDAVDRAARKLQNLEKENTDLRAIIYRLVKEHGSTMNTEPIEERELDKLMRSAIFIGPDNKVCIIDF